MNPTFRHRAWRVALTVAVVAVAAVIGRAAAHTVADALRPRRAVHLNEKRSGPPHVAIGLPPAPPDSEQPLAHMPGGEGGVLRRRYISPRSPESVAAYYQLEMRNRGWVLQDRLSDKASQEYPGRLMFFQGSGEECIVAVSTSEISGETTVTIIAGRVPKGRTSP